MTTRRQIVLALGAGALIAPLPSIAQQPEKVWRIGLLWAGSAKQVAIISNFVDGLRALGYVEGRNITFEWRFAEDRYERLPQLAEELARQRVDVIFTTGTPSTRAAQRATKTIPIVVAGFADPVAGGFAASLAHPDGNITGFASMFEDIEGKRLELLASVLPQGARIAYLVNPANPALRLAEEFVASLEKNGKGVLVVRARNMDEISKGFASMAKQHAAAVLVPDEPTFIAHTPEIAKLAARHKLPSCFAGKRGPETGGLMSYGVNYPDVFRSAAKFVDKILKGANPGDIPIERPTRFEFIVNLNSAKALGLTIPPSILLRADRVIE